MATLPPADATRRRSQKKLPTKVFAENEEAQSMSTLLFGRLDSDGSGFLERQELTRARQLMLSAVAGTGEPHSPRGAEGLGLIDNIDHNHDGRIDVEEWERFSSSMYEILGERRFMKITRHWYSQAKAQDMSPRKPSVCLKGWHKVCDDSAVSNKDLEKIADDAWRHSVCSKAPKMYQSGDHKHQDEEEEEPKPTSPLAVTGHARRPSDASHLEKRRPSCGRVAAVEHGTLPGTATGRRPSSRSQSKESQHARDGDADDEAENEGMWKVCVSGGGTMLVSPKNLRKVVDLDQLGGNFLENLKSQVAGPTSPDCGVRLRPGDKALIVGMQSEQHLNGIQVTIEAWVRRHARHSAPPPPAPPLPSARHDFAPVTARSEPTTARQAVPVVKPQRDEYTVKLKELSEVEGETGQVDATHAKKCTGSFRLVEETNEKDTSDKRFRFENAVGAVMCFKTFKWSICYKDEELFFIDSESKFPPTGTWAACHSMNRCFQCQVSKADSSLSTAKRPDRQRIWVRNRIAERQKEKNPSFNDGHKKSPTQSPEQTPPGSREPSQPPERRDSLPPEQKRRPSLGPPPGRLKPHKHSHSNKIVRKKKRRRAHKLTHKSELFNQLLYNGGVGLTKLTIHDIMAAFSRSKDTGLDSTLPREIPMFRHDLHYEPVDLTVESVARLTSFVIDCPDETLEKNAQLLSWIKEFRDKDVQESVQLEEGERDRVVTSKQFGLLFEVLAYLLRVDEVYISTHMGWTMSGRFEPTDTLVALIMEEVAGKIVNPKELEQKRMSGERRMSKAPSEKKFSNAPSERRMSKAPSEKARKRTGSICHVANISRQAAEENVTRSLPVGETERPSAEPDPESEQPKQLPRANTEPVQEGQLSIQNRAVSEPICADAPKAPSLEGGVGGQSSSSSSTSSSSSSSDTSASDWSSDDLPDLDLLRVKFTYNDWSRLIWNSGLIDPLGRKGLPSSHLAYAFSSTCMKMPRLLEDRAEARPAKAKPPKMRVRNTNMLSAQNERNPSVKGRTQFGILLEEVWKEIPAGAQLNSPLNMCRHMLRTAREAEAEREAQSKEAEKAAKKAAEAAEHAATGAGDLVKLGVAKILSHEAKAAENAKTTD